jgi:hypothetical protein
MPISPAEQRLATFLSPAFKKEAFRVDRSRPLTFVCGGNDHNGVSALRLQFLAHLAGSAPPILPVLAEKAFPHQLIERNLQRFEEFLASAADCVLIFVESPGSFAETGLFAGLPAVMEKTFVVNTRNESHENSFLTLGPIKLIRKESLFDDVFELEGEVVTAQEAQGIVNTIIKTLPRYENALVFHPTHKFTELEVRLQLACVQMTVALLWAGSARLITSILREHFKAVETETIERFLSLLTSIDALGRQDELYFYPKAEAFKDDVLICSAHFSVEGVKAQSLGWQVKNNSQVAVFLREQRKIDI